MKKIAVIAAVSLTIIIALSFAVFMIIAWRYNGELPFTAPSYRKADRFLSKNIDVMSRVSDALFDMDYAAVGIRHDADADEKLTMTVRRDTYNHEEAPIPNELLASVQHLLKCGIVVISRGSGTVNYTMWSAMDESRGIIFSQSGEAPDGEQLYEVRKLSEDGWYYYIHNYEKAKAKNPQLFE